MKRAIASITFLLMFIVFSVPAGAVEPEIGGLPMTAFDVPSEVPASSQEWEVLSIVNDERMSEGLLPLTMLPVLQSATDIRAHELIQKQEHTRPDGSPWYTVFDEVGAVYSNAGENIAAGYSTPAAVMTAWMNSPGHRANILNADFRHIGVGYEYSQSGSYHTYWVQLFMTGWSCGYTAFEVLGELDMSTPVDELALAGRFTCGEGYCYMPLTEAMCTGDVTENGVRTVTFSCFGLTASISFGSAPLDGDVDGSGVVDTSDALLALRYALGIVDLTHDQLLCADVNGDGSVDTIDALIIMRIAMGVV